MSEEMTLDLSPRKYQIPGTSYTLVEPSEAAYIKYQDMQIINPKFREGKLEGSAEKINQSHSVLVAECLFETDAKGDLKSVGLERVKKMPTRVIRVLADKAREMGELDNKGGKDQMIERRDALNKLIDNLDGRDEEAVLKNGSTDGAGISA